MNSELINRRKKARGLLWKKYKEKYQPAPPKEDIEKNPLWKEKKKLIKENDKKIEILKFMLIGKQRKLYDKIMLAR